MTSTATLEGLTVLVVEDEYFLAKHLVQGLGAVGATVVGPAGSIDDALDLIDDVDHLDAALLDLNLRGEMAFPVADALVKRGIRFLFTTGYDQAVIPPRYVGVTRCEKPADIEKIARELLR